MQDNDNTIQPIIWQDDHLRLLDQRLLPANETYNAYHDVISVADAIRQMVVRGAPAIGITAAYGIVLAARHRFATNPQNWQTEIETDLSALAASRPTAVNLFWAIDHMRRVIGSLQGDPADAVLAEAKRIHNADIAANRAMGELGASLLADNSKVITHCNTGALATGGYGTALGVIRTAHTLGKLAMVYADETRPWLQGARLTAWELKKENIPVKLMVEGAAAALMKQEKPDWVIVGADRIAANGDVANKIGTYSLAVLARHHGVRFMVVAPTTTIDMQTETGEKIPIEFRDEVELTQCAGNTIAPDGVSGWNPVFDVTPAELVDAIVTERGIVQTPDSRQMQQLFCS
jgi:methylthioribose-1-phosphate isomerase